MRGLFARMGAAARQPRHHDNADAGPSSLRASLRRALGQAACGLAVLLGLAGAASAGTFVVSPVKVTLSAGRPVASLTVRNTGSDSVVLQLEAAAWSQQAGKDVYAPTREILATPPIFTVPAGGAQLVRVGLRRAPDAERELAYRLFLKEVPPPPKPGFRGLQVAVHVSIPVFGESVRPAAPALSWQASRDRDGGLRLRVANRGSAHVRISRLELIPAGGGQPLTTRQELAYVLPGESRDWAVPLRPVPPAGSRLLVAAKTDGGEVRTELVIGSD